MPRKPLKEGQPKVEALTMRISPKMKFGLDLLCRKQHRNLTSVMEWALEKALKDINDGLAMEIETLDGRTKLVPALDRLWHTEECGRLANIAFYWPSLLTYEEDYIWQIISKNAYYWRVREYESEINSQKRNSLTWAPIPGLLLIDKVRQDWPILKKIRDEQSDPLILPYFVPGEQPEPPEWFSIEKNTIPSNLLNKLDIVKVKIFPSQDTQEMKYKHEHNNQIKTLIETLELKLGNTTEAEELIEEITERLEQSPPYYYRY